MKKFKQFLSHLPKIIQIIKKVQDYVDLKHLLKGDFKKILERIPKVIYFLDAINQLFDFSEFFDINIKRFVNINLLEFSSIFHQFQGRIKVNEDTVYLFLVCLKQIITKFKSIDDFYKFISNYHEVEVLDEPAEQHQEGSN